MKGIDKSIVIRWMFIDSRTIRVRRWQMRVGDTKHDHTLTEASRERAMRVDVAKAMKAH
jgi:hypothetical protein